MIRPYMKFFTSDWRSDPRLRMCSIAARGLWLEMICIMHEAEPYGHLLVAGQVVTVKQLATLAGVPLNETSKLLGELERSGVYSVEQDVILSRRMVRDKAKADKDRENGKGGGNPKLTAADKPGVNPPDNGEDKAHILEARKKEDAADAATSDLEKQLFSRGKEVAGKDAGGLIAKLLKAKKGDLALARAAIEMAATKQNPREYIGAVIAGGHASADGKRLTNDEQYWGPGRTPGIV